MAPYGKLGHLRYCAEADAAATIRLDAEHDRYEWRPMRVSPNERLQMDTVSQSSVATFLTPRLLLRDFRSDDAPKMAEIFGERESWPHILRSQRRPEYRAAFVPAAAAYAHAVPFAVRPYLVLAAVLRETDEVIGMCSLTQATAASRIARIGWHFSISHSGAGYATEAGRELLRFGLEERKLARVYADCFESNAANRRVLAKLGMQPLPYLPILRWFFALRYCELRPIVRYSIENKLLVDDAVTA